jgi:hypothetical protein
VTRPKWKLILVLSDIVLILIQDRCTVCVELTKVQKWFCTHPMELLGDVGHVEPCFFPFGDSVTSMQDRCTVCARHTNGSEIVLDAPDGTLR